jgi:predicted nucleic acid-binding protein
MPGVERARAAVVDASVAVKWVVDEPGSRAAAALLDAPILWLAPRLLVVEVAAAIRRKVAGGELRTDVGLAAVAAVLDAARDGTVRLVDDEALVASAFLLSLSLRHRVPDCLYLALAEREGCALSTADLRLARLASSRKVPILEVRETTG